MEIRIYENLENILIEINNHDILTALANYIELATTKVRPIEIRYSYATEIGVIVCDKSDDISVEQIRTICNDYITLYGDIHNGNNADRNTVQN